MDGGTSDPGAEVNREVWGFLRGYTTYGVYSSDYSGRVARYSYWLFMPLDV